MWTPLSFTGYYTAVIKIILTAAMAFIGLLTRDRWLLGGQNGYFVVSGHRCSVESPFRHMVVSTVMYLPENIFMGLGGVIGGQVVYMR